MNAATTMLLPSNVKAKGIFLIHSIHLVSRCVSSNDPAENRSGTTIAEP